MLLCTSVIKEEENSWDLFFTYDLSIWVLDILWFKFLLRVDISVLICSEVKFGFIVQVIMAPQQHRCWTWWIHIQPEFRPVNICFFRLAGEWGKTPGRLSGGCDEQIYSGKDFFAIRAFLYSHLRVPPAVSSSSPSAISTNIVNMQETLSNVSMRVWHRIRVLRHALSLRGARSSEY